MSDRRLVGIDLGIASAHAVRILDGEGVTLAKRKAWPTVASLTELETVALQDTPGGDTVGDRDGTDRAGVVADRGVLHQSRSPCLSGEFGGVGGSASLSVTHAKTNGIDADTLARVPLVNPRGVQPLVLA